MTAALPAVRLELLNGEPREMAALSRVLDAAPTYAERITGAPPGSADAQSLYSALPEGKEYSDKFVFGIYDDAKMIGCADLIRAYPDARTALLGLLLMAEPFQRKGFGTAAFLAIERYVRGWKDGCDRIRIGVVRTNEDVLPFWTKLGFAPTGEVKPYRYSRVVSETIVLEKRLGDPLAH